MNAIYIRDLIKIFFSVNNNIIINFFMSSSAVNFLHQIFIIDVCIFCIFIIFYIFKVSVFKIMLSSSSIQIFKEFFNCLSKALYVLAKIIHVTFLKHGEQWCILHSAYRYQNILTERKCLQSLLCKIKSLLPHLLTDGFRILHVSEVAFGWIGEKCDEYSNIIELLMKKVLHLHHLWDWACFGCLKSARFTKNKSLQ